MSGEPELMPSLEEYYREKIPADELAQDSWRTAARAA